MNPSPAPYPPFPSTIADFPPSPAGCGCLKRSVCWGAILAGTSAALALQVLFMLLGAGLGFAIYTPLTDAHPIADLGKGAAVVQGVSAVFSLWFGGWVAGRFTPIGSRLTGWLHGFSVWCAATVAGVLFVSFGAGWALGDLSKLVGGGLSLAGKPAAMVAGGVADVAKDAIKQSGDMLTSFTDEAVGRRPAGGNANDAIRAKREVGLAVVRLFNPAHQADVTANRAAVVKALVDTAGLSAAEAEKTVTAWTATYEQLKADLTAAKNEAELKARETAEQASNALALFSLCAFVGFALGALSASYGGSHGAKCAQRCDARTDATVG
jgi:hypothetical protein